MYNSSRTQSRTIHNTLYPNRAILPEAASQSQTSHQEKQAILGCGYVGSALANVWKESGHCVTGTTTHLERVAALSNLVTQIVVMQGENFEAVQSLVKGQQTVVVSVAPTASKRMDETTNARTYLETAKNLVMAIGQTSTVKQIIFLSRCSVYGDRDGKWVSETSHVSPLEPKSQLIWEAERLLRQAAKETLQVCILRLGNIYGPGRDLASRYQELVRQTLSGRGDRFVHWAHRDDIVRAIEFVRANQLDGIYNVVDDCYLTVREQVDSFRSHQGLPPIQWDISTLSLLNQGYRVSNQKLKAEGFQFIHPQVLI